MRRYLIAGSVMLAMIVPAAADLGACGDKYARVGASSRLKAYRPMYPTSVLVVSPAGATKHGIADFQKILEKGGHTPTFVPHGSDVAKAITTGKYDLIIAHYDDASMVRSVAAGIPGAPTMVMILPEKSKKLEHEVQKTYAHIIAPYKMSKWDALEEMDNAMKVRVKPASAPDGSR